MFSLIELTRLIQIARFRVPAGSCVAVVLIVASTTCILHFGARSRNPIPKAAKWKTTGKFVVQGVYPSTKFDVGVNVGALSDMIFWGSWAGDDRNTGELASPTFRAPSILGMFVAGYPTKPEMAFSWNAKIPMSAFRSESRPILSRGSTGKNCIGWCRLAGERKPCV